jgi:biopolymer transport protein ExbD
MAIQIRNKRKAEANMSSVADLVFLLLIFFILTSTLVSTTGVKLLLPQSNNRTTEAQPKLVLSIDENLNYFLDGIQMDEEQIKNALVDKLSKVESATIRLEANFTVPLQEVVNLMDLVNEINKTFDTKHKIVIATKSKRRR